MTSAITTLPASADATPGQFIDGRAVPGHGPNLELRSPRDGSVLVLIAGAAGDDVTAAYAAADGARYAWAASAPKARSDILRRAATLFRERAEEIGSIIAAEMGKPVTEARTEVTKGSAIFDFYANAGYAAQGETYRTDTGEDVFVFREPLGVVALVTPWNFPFTLPSRKVAAALAAGNAALLKPAPGGVMSALEIATTLHDAGLPAGVLNVIYGENADLQDRLFGDPRLAGVSFTGSWASAHAIRQMVPVHVPLQAELGGKNALVVWKDADPDTAVELIVASSFPNNGQICTSAGRVLVHCDVADVVLARLSTAIRSRPTNDYGVLANSSATTRVTDVVGRNADHVRDVICSEWPPGLVAPALMVEPEPGELRREEIFGPVITFERFSSLDEAISLANDTNYGLTAGIISHDLRVARTFWSRSNAGTVKVNAPLTGAPFHVPMEGFGHSGGGGGEGGSVSLDFFTRRKTVHLRRD